MEQPKLFFSNSTKKYYCEDALMCVNCKSDLNDWFALITFWNKKESWCSPYCGGCFDKIKANALVSEYKLVLAMRPPDDSHPVFITPPELVPGRYKDVFEAAQIKAQGVKIIDRTKLADKESIQGAQIGADINEFLAEKEKALEMSKPLKFIENLAKSDKKDKGGKRKCLKTKENLWK